MAHSTKGLLSLLNNTHIYNFTQNIMGVNRLMKNFVDNYIKPFPNCKILDIGCGSGILLGFLKDVVYYGFDLNEQYIKSAKERFGDRGHFYCNVVENTDNSPIKGMKFDIVIAHGVLHHLDDDQTKALFNTSISVLSDDGRLITKDPCFIPKQNPIARFLIKRDRGKNVRSPEEYEKIANKYFNSVKGEVSIKNFIPWTYFTMECKKIF